MSHTKAPFDVLFLSFFVLFCAGTAEAQQGAGIKIVPATIEELVEPGETMEVDLTVTNVNSNDSEFFLYTREIKGVEDGNVPIFSEQGAEVTGFEITEWIHFDFESIAVPAGSEVVVPVTIRVPEDATPGSHFGGIFVSAEPPRLRSIGAGVGYEVAAIASLRVAGDVIDEARIRSFATDKYIHGSKDITFQMHVENLGNILIKPRGPLSITNMFGQEVAVLSVNNSLAGVFPGAIHGLETKWTDESLGFGRYEAVVALAYDGNNGQRTIDSSVTFWILPGKIIIPILIALVVIFGIGYFLIRMYVNQAVARVSGGRRIVRSRRYGRRAGVSRFAFIFVTLLSVTVLFLIFILVLLA